MLTRQEAWLYLQDEQTLHWLQSCLDAIRATLPADIQPIAYALLDHDEHGKPYVYLSDKEKTIQYQQSINRNFHLLNNLDAKSRLAIFSSIVPGTAIALEAAWQLLGQRNYQAGYLFRAPGDNNATFYIRVSWLKSMLSFLPLYRDKDLQWLADNSHYLTDQRNIGILFAAIIDTETSEEATFFDTVLTIAHGKHATSVVNKAITIALLTASRPEGWSCIEQLLLAAQREEGLRLMILESADNAHPQAFRRLLQLILEHNLLRFSAVVHILNAWLGMRWEATEGSAIRESLIVILRLFDDAGLRQELLAQGDPQQVYFVLWVSAFENATTAITAAAPRLSDPLAVRRCVATYLLALLALPATLNVLASQLVDPDLRVSLLAVRGIAHILREPNMPAASANDDHTAASFIPTDLFEQLELLLPRLKANSKTIASGIWPWLRIQSDPATVLSLMCIVLGDRSPRRLIPYFSRLDEHCRLSTTYLLAALPVWDDAVLNILYRHVGDRTTWVRSHILDIVSERPLVPAAIMILEDLLTRRSSDVRQDVITLLSKATDDQVLASVDRLLTSSYALQRLAGLDLLHTISHAERAIRACQERVRIYQQGQEVLSAEETPLIGAILMIDGSQEAPIRTRENVLGLISLADCSPRIAPQRCTFELQTAAALACLSALAALVEEHQAAPLVIHNWQGSHEVLLGNSPHELNGIVSKAQRSKDPRADFPLVHVWQTWERTRTADQRDSDGLELLRGLLYVHQQIIVNFFMPWLQNLPGEDRSAIEPTLDLQYIQIVSALLEWLLHLRGISGAMLDFLLDVAETRLADISPDGLKLELMRQEEKVEFPRAYLRSERRKVLESEASLAILKHYMSLHAGVWTPSHYQRYWRLLHWVDQPFYGLERQRPHLEVVLAAYHVGAATEADILDQLSYFSVDTHDVCSPDLIRLSQRQPDPLLEEYSILQKLLPALSARILEVELERGELPTAATELALSLRSIYGVAFFVGILSLLSPAEFSRNNLDSDKGKGAVFNHLLRISYPKSEDTATEFSHFIKTMKIDIERLIAAAVYVPQWASLIEAFLNWPCFEDAVWWISAHTKDGYWSIHEQEIQADRQAQIAKRTSLTAQELRDGAADVDWFWRCYTALGEARWERLYAAAKYASEGSGYGRARLFADAILGKLIESELLQRINVKRMQDAARALGLLPLPDDDTRQATIQARYTALQEFLRDGRKFGVQRRENEKIAVTIGLENLARTAGYPDPIRLQWAMEALVGGELRSGSLSLTVDDVQVTLTLDKITAEPSLNIIKGTSRLLKSLPTALKKRPEIVTLLERKSEIERQISRMRLGLEAAMCRGDLFTASEMLKLLEHPVLSRLLRSLVFLRATCKAILGYPQLLEGSAGPELSFVSHDGSLIKIDQLTTDLRLAHPTDLFESSAWSDWQHECFTARRMQPFKQIFRELYLYTANEIRNGDDACSWRYSGHQVQPRQAQALLGQRGWISSYNSCDANRTFQREGVTACIVSQSDYFSAGEMGGEALDYVYFIRNSDGQTIPLVQVPSRIFSEVMRDLDLIVSAAASSGIDPETSASTVEMRTTLVGEMCLLLGLQNVTLQSAHALIKGTMGNYSVHLSSGTVHRQPGGALCIIPVHAQHLGRLFLPFADDDPKTAEVVTKIVTLARDQEIKDPTILEQLR